MIIINILFDENISFFDTSKSVVENLSYLSGTIVCILGLIGIWQLLLAVKGLKVAKETLDHAKDQFIISSKRESAYHAAQLCDKFIKDVVVKVNDFENKNRSFKYPKVIGGINNFDSLSDIKVSNREEAIETIKNFFDTNPEFFLTVLNDMETFSLYFTKQIADEDIAYQTIGKTFIDYVECFHYPIILMNLAQQNTAYRNLRELYNKWRFKK